MSEHTDTSAAFAAVGGCRECPVRCTRVVYPSHCVASRCPSLYLADRFGRRVMGCTHGVFGVEVDVERFRELQRSRAGFGGLRVWREPFDHCGCGVEPAFEHRHPGECVNPGFRASAPLSAV
ncbi:MAG: hypothetical protein KDC33_11000 [Thermoleophilia bacterium]|nr:hypothetical protein [Thermoleophilia bacterium]